MKTGLTQDDVEDDDHDFKKLHPDVHPQLDLRVQGADKSAVGVSIVALEGEVAISCEFLVAPALESTV